MDDRLRVPHFQLQRMYDDGSSDEPEIHALNGIDSTCRMGRRGFLLTSAIGTAAIAALSGCVPQFGGLTDPTAERGLEKVFTPDPVAHAKSVKGAVAHQRSVNTLAFSPDGKTLVSGSDDQTIKFWSIPEGKLSRTFKTAAEVKALALTPDGRSLVTGLRNGEIRSQTPPSAKPAVLVKAGAPLSQLILGPDGKTMAAIVPKNSIQIRSLPKGNLLREIPGSFYCAAFSPDGAMLACGNYTNARTTLYAVSSGQAVKEWENIAESIRFSPDGGTLASRKHYALRIWDMPAAKQRKGLDVFTQNVQRPSAYTESLPLAFSPDGAWLAIAAGKQNSGVALLPRPYDSMALFLEGTAAIETFAFSPDSRFLAAGLSDGSIFLWEMPAANSQARFHGALLDPAAVSRNVSLRQATTSEKSIYVGPCGDPLPAGAVCTCNCVSGKYSPPVRTCTCNTVPTGRYCSCNTICTCVPVK